ncbi:MAG: hypothetical protein LBI15_08205, partial [Dysgonamonadaceae bacterium]|nr:hypothetical protein [Dysgonamonadaceae bacterium]
MKYIVFTILATLMVLPGFAQSSNLFNIDNGVGIEVHEFKERNDSLHVIYSVHMDARAIARFQGMSITPGVEANEALLLLPSFVVVGPNKERVLTRHYRNNRLGMPDFDVNWRNDNLVTYSVSVPYQAWMDNARLVIQQEIQSYRAHSVFNRFALSNRVELSPREPYSVQTQVALTTPEREVKILDRSGQAFLDFASGSSVIQPNFRRNPEELRKIEEAVRAVTTNPDATLQGIF